MAYAHLKDYQQALQECERAIMLAPRKTLPYLNRGIIHLWFDHFREALQDSEYVIAVNSPSAKVKSVYGRMTKCQVVAHINCGAAHVALKEYQPALQHFEQAIQLDPQFAHSYYGRGMTYLWLNNMDLARADIEQCWSMNARGCAYGLVLIWLDFCQIKPNQDIRERLEAIGHLDEMDYYARISRGIAQWIQGQNEEALATLQQYLDTEPETAFVSFWIGVVCASLGRDDEAITMLNHSLERRLPPSLLTPLRWLEEINSSFYQHYALPLLNQ
jgi:tetratricopeptide (TPR) repeat protein